MLLSRMQVNKGWHIPYEYRQFFYALKLKILCQKIKLFMLLSKMLVSKSLHISYEYKQC
jgi:hypothetical protein